MNSNVFNIIEYGALGDGISDNTSVIKKAIDECHSSGGGVVFVPAGNFLTGPIILKSNINLFLSPGSNIKFTGDPDKYGIVKTRWEGTECYALSPMIFGDGLENVSITGFGTIDGQGQSWWKNYNDIKNGKTLEFKCIKVIEEKNRDILKTAGSGGGGIRTGFLRPPLVQFKNCNNVTVEGVTLQNSAFWNTHILYCSNVEIHNVKFKNPDNSPNTDGLDIDSSRCVRISGCLFDVGDDCLCLKSGMDEDGRRVGIPSEIITVTNCIMNRGHGGIVFGSECSGGIRNIAVSNCVFNGTDRGIRIKSRRMRGGYIENVNISNIIMENVLSPFVFNLFYKCGADEKQTGYLNAKTKQPVNETTPYIKNFTISGISSYKTRSSCGFFSGLPEMPIANLSLNDIHIEMDEVGSLETPAMNFDGTKMKKGGFYGSYLSDCKFSNIDLNGVSGAGIDFTECDDMILNGISIKQDTNSITDIKLKSCRNIMMTDCRINGGQIKVNET